MIHLITTIERGGAEKSLVRLATKQVSSGKSVSVIYLKGKGELISDLTAGGVEILSQFSNRNFFLQLFLLRKFFKSVTRGEAVIHAHLPRAELVTYLVLLLLGRQPRYVATRHNAEPFWPNGNRFISSFLSRTLHKRSELVVISEAVKEFLQRSNEVISGRDVAVIYYSINPNSSRKVLDEFTNNESHAPSLEDLKIGTIARFEPQKQVGMLIDAFFLLQKDYNDWTLHILGDGSQGENLKAHVAKLGLNEKVFFYAKTSQVDNFLKSLDFFVLSSLYEGFGLVLLEAMLASVPIVASNTTAIPEVLGINHPGLVFPIDSQRFANAVSRFAQDIEIRRCALSVQEERLNFFINYPEVEDYDSVYGRLTTPAM